MGVRAAGEARIAEPAASFRHEALFYGGESQFLAAALPYIHVGLAAGEQVMVAVGLEKIDLLRARLGPDAGNVTFADMTDVGRNPAAMIPLWSDFVEPNAERGRPCRAIGEPAWAGRGDAALVECRNHEELVNLAFDGGPTWCLLCSFDEDTLGGQVIADARTSHPFLLAADGPGTNSHYEPDAPGWLGRDDPLPPPPTSSRQMAFGPASLSAIRSAVSVYALTAGLSPERADDFVLAVNELVGNSVRHGGGVGELRLWTDEDVLVGEVSDRGTITDPLAGRRRPAPEQAGGRGLWIVNHVCDLVQIRSSPRATVVRLHIAR